MSRASEQARTLVADVARYGLGYDRERVTRLLTKLVADVEYLEAALRSVERDRDHIEGG
jgi:hypothetical protein